MQPRDKLRVNLSVRIWPDIHQQVGIAASRADEPAFQFLWAFILTVADVESPGAVERVRHLQRELLADIAGVEACRILTGKIVLEGLDILTRFGSLMMIGNDQRGRLQL